MARKKATPKRKRAPRKPAVKKRATTPIVWAEPEICPLCGALDSYRVYKVTHYSFFTKRLRKCKECGRIEDQRKRNSREKKA